MRQSAGIDHGWSQRPQGCRRGAPADQPPFQASQITRTQRGDLGLQTPLDLRRIRHTTAYGLHDDATASLQLYNDGTWYCFGACKAGGSIFDFASRVFGLETKGRAFLELRGRLAGELLPLTQVSNVNGRQS